VSGNYSLDDVVRMREERDPWADRIAAEVVPDAEVVMPVVAQFDALVHEWADLSTPLGNLCRQLEPIVGEDALGVAADPAETTGPDMHGTSHLIRRLHSLATDIRSARRDLQHFINRIEV
jgi:hypothetical protein